MRRGALYSTGRSPYDAFFESVHAEQVSAAKWSSEREATRRPLITALHTTEDASDSALAQSTHDHLGARGATTPEDGSPPDDDLFRAVEQTVRAENDRAKRLTSLHAKLQELAREGHRLEPHIADDFRGQGQKPFEVKDEIRASYDVLAGLSKRAKEDAREATAFVADLKRVAQIGNEAPRVVHAEKPPPPEKPHRTVRKASREEPPPPPSAPPRAVPAPAPKPAPVAHEAPAAPKPAPPKSPDPGEVFQP